MKNRMKGIKATFLMLMLCANSVCCVWAKAETEVSDNTDSESESGTGKTENEILSGERTAMIVVQSITGNELTYYEIESESESTSDAEKTEGEGEPDVSQMQKGMRPDMEQMPERNEKDFSGYGSRTGKDGGSQEGLSGDRQNDIQKENRSGMMKNSAMNNMKTVYLPVPVVVHTDTGENMTFSILESGDKLEVTIITDEKGKETITEIWMLGSEEDSE